MLHAKYPHERVPQQRSDRPQEVNRFIDQHIIDNREDVMTLNLQAIDDNFHKNMAAAIQQESSKESASEAISKSKSSLTLPKLKTRS
jgi:hypothetical protein